MSFPIIVMSETVEFVTNEPNNRKIVIQYVII